MVNTALRFKKSFYRVFMPMSLKFYKFLKLFAILCQTTRPDAPLTIPCSVHKFWVIITDAPTQSNTTLSSPPANLLHALAALRHEFFAAKIAKIATGVRNCKLISLSLRVFRSLTCSLMGYRCIPLSKAAWKSAAATFSFSAPRLKPFPIGYFQLTSPVIAQEICKILRLR